VLLLLGLWWWWRGRGGEEVVGTFNIRTFSGARSDKEAVAAALASLRADLVAVQEIQDQELFAEVVARAGELSGREYRVALSPSCRGVEGLHLGVVYDAGRYSLVEQRRLSPVERGCPFGQPAAALTRLLREDGEGLGVVSVHLKALDSPRDHETRRAEWGWLLEQRRAIEAEIEAPVIVAGDFNSTGFLRPDHEERRFIDERVAAEGLRLPTAGIGCSMYWRSPDERRYVVSLLDHVLAPGAVEVGEAEALGMCEALRCEAQDAAPPGFHTVSDHCPVRVVMRR